MYDLNSSSFGVGAEKKHPEKSEESKRSCCIGRAEMVELFMWIKSPFLFVLQIHNNTKRDFIPYYINK